jgi:hypothetical protein
MARPPAPESTTTLASAQAAGFVVGGEPLAVELADQITVTGDWVKGWAGTIPPPASHVHIRPFGGGTGITFHVDRDIAVQPLARGQGPWEVDGSFTPDPELLTGRGSARNRLAW